MKIHKKASEGFGSSADLYEQGRPGYPPAAIDFLVSELGLSHRSSVLDLAAGTGKLTRELVGRFSSVQAVEPVEAMREQFKRLLPEIPIVDGTAEEMPCSDDSFDAVFVAQAFHWFDRQKALREIHRTLKTNGWLALLWNSRGKDVDWVKQVWDVIKPFRADVPWYGQDERQMVETDERLFGPVSRQVFDYDHHLSRRALIARVGSTSFVAAMDEDQRKPLLDRIEQILDTHPQTRGEQDLRLPYLTEVFWSRRR